MIARAKRATLALLAGAAFVAGCSGPQGILGTETYPSGNIVVQSYPGGTTLETSPSKPYMVADTFSIALSEKGFDGPYSVTMYSWNNHFNEACFVPHQTSATIYTFKPDHANPVGSPASEANPCSGGDVETALINDGKGHDLYFSFELTATLTGGAVPTPVPTSSGGGTACSQGDPNLASLTLTGSQQQFTFPACNDFVVTGTMPANGQSGDDLEYGISGDSQFGDSTTSANGTPVFSLLLEPSPEAITFSNTAQSLLIVAQSSKFGGGTYTLELRDDDVVVATVPGIQPSNNTLDFNVHPTGGTFSLDEYVAILYRN